MSKEYITTTEIVHSFPTYEVEHCGLFEVTGKQGSQGWALRKSTKAALDGKGYHPFFKDGTTGKGASCWSLAVMEVLKTIVAEGLANQQQDDAPATPLTAAEITNTLLANILQELKELNKKWN